jgi:hypothetical protein
MNIKVMFIPVTDLAETTSAAKRAQKWLFVGVCTKMIIHLVDIVEKLEA